MPGMVNLHGHLQDSRGGSSIEMPFPYQLNLWLASGITTIRDLGCDRSKGLALREQSEAGEVIAPRIFLYMMVGGATPKSSAYQIPGYYLTR